MLIGALVIIGYTFTGGFHAVCWTDFFQGMLMAVVLVIVPLAAMNLLGGPAETIALANQVGPGFLSLFHTVDGSAVSWIAIVSSLAWGLGYLGMPHILVRFMAIKKVKMIKTSRRVATAWIIVSLTFACLLGLVGRVFLEPGLFTDAAGAQTVFIVMAGRIFPPVVAGVLFSAIMAAIMSTSDSQLLVCSSAITNDIYLKVKKKKPSQKTLLWMGRISVLAIAVIGAMMALDEKSSIMALVKYAWGGFGAAFGPVILMALFWKRMTRTGALVGMVTGFATVILWNNFLAESTGLYELVPGFIFALAGIVIASLLDKKPSDEIVEEFERSKLVEE
jgi:sodium/proline symporter